MNHSQNTQASLLLRIRDEHDAQSWSRFTCIYSPLVQGFLRKRGLQDADAADLTQEVLSRVVTGIKNFDYDPAKGTFRGWLFTIVQNCLRNFVARERHAARGTGDTRVQQALSQYAQSADDGEWERDYQRHLLQRAAGEIRGTFQDSTWQAFWQTAIEGRAPKDVATDLGTTVAAVYMAKHRVILGLRRQIEHLEKELT